MQTTYLKQTASTLLKTARVTKMQAGNFEVVINVPKLGDCHAHIWGRLDGWGGTIHDVLGLENVYGERLSLATTSHSLARLEELVAEANAKTLSELRAAGELI